MVEAAGFTGFGVAERFDVFCGADQEAGAARFGTQGLNFIAQKGG